MGAVNEKTALLNTLRNANILNHDDLLSFKNHSLDNEYETHGWRKCNKVTILMLLIDLLNKYPSSSSIINNIIKKYINQLPEEMYKINGDNISAIMLCIYNSFIDTIKVLLNNGININHQYDDSDNWTIIHYAICWIRDNDGLNIIKLLTEYDANTYIDDGDVLNLLRDKNAYIKVNRILRNATILNSKN